MRVSADFMTKNGAEMLASYIEMFWHKRGGKVHVHVERANNGDGRGEYYIVRSNLVNGLPAA